MKAYNTWLVSLTYEVVLINSNNNNNYWSNHLFQSNQRFQAIEFVDRPVPEKFGMGFLFYELEVLQVECVTVNLSQVQSYPYKHMCDIRNVRRIVKFTSSSIWRLNRWYLKYL